MPLSYDQAAVRVTETLRHAIVCQNDGRFNAIGKDYRNIYDDLTEGMFTEVCRSQSLEFEGRPPLQTYGELLDYQERLGVNYQKVFNALRFLNEWTRRDTDWKVNRIG